MAKGQQRSNREIRKPKKEKAAEKPATSFGSQVQQSGGGIVLRGKQKS